MFVAGSGMLSISIALNAVSDHATCTAVYVIAAAASTYILGSIRTLERISWIAWVGVICIVTSRELAFFLCQYTYVPSDDYI